jgi:hypothetical protein
MLSEVERVSPLPPIATARSMLLLPGNDLLRPELGRRAETSGGSAAMKHRSCQILFEHWCDRRGGRRLPERSEIDPASIRQALGDTFILSFNTLANHPFRLAGTRVCALFGRELKDHGFITLWTGAARAQAETLVRAAADDSVAVLSGAIGHNVGGLKVELELLLLPLRHCGQTHLRMIGVLAPLVAPYWVGASPVTALALGEPRFLGHIEERTAPSIAPAAPASPARRRHGLTVYDGGQP